VTSHSSLDLELLHGVTSSLAAELVLALKETQLVFVIPGVALRLLSHDSGACWRTPGLLHLLSATSHS
jgi:hypothetical protein